MKIRITKCYDILFICLFILSAILLMVYIRIHVFARNLPTDKFLCSQIADNMQNNPPNIMFLLTQNPIGPTDRQAQYKYVHRVERLCWSPFDGHIKIAHKEWSDKFIFASSSSPSSFVYPFCMRFIQ